MRFLDLVKPLTYITVQVKEPKRALTYTEKALYTFVVLLVFLMLGQVPLFGLDKQLKADPTSWMRTIMVSNRGTLMELGISPIITTQMVLQLVQGAKLISMNNIAEDRGVMKATTKFFSVLLTFGQAFSYVISGWYGPYTELGFIKASLIVTQLTLAGVLIILLDEMLGKGYGLSQGGISLFIAVNLAETVLWRSLSPITVNTGRGAEFEGAVVNFLHLLLTRPDKIRAVREGFLRAHQPNMFQVVATVLVFLVSVYMNEFKINLSLRSSKVRGVEQTYPIKLFGSNMPVILQAALLQNITFVSQLLWRRFEGNPLVRLLGRWGIDERTGQYEALGGLAYYLKAPDSFSDVLLDPIHGLAHFVFVVGCCALFAATYLEISGNSPRDVTKMFRDSDLYIANQPRGASMFAYLDSTMRTAALLGGATIGALTVVADLAGALGSGTGLLLAVQIIGSIHEEYKKEIKVLSKGLKLE